MNGSNIVVISDSHGNVAALASVLGWVHNTGVNAAIFLGDGFEDLSPASARTGFALPWHAVRGNGDFYSSIPDSMVLEIPGKNPALPVRKLFLAHGNCYHVREGYKTIAAVARNAGAEAALFGHTHIPYCATIDGIFLLNPGSISRPRSNTGCTFAVLECLDSGPLAAHFFTLVNRGGRVAIEQLKKGS